MKQLREFLHRQIEAFLNHEFGPMQNMTPGGIRRILWTPEHTARLVGHLAGNWEMVEEALRLWQEEPAPDAALHGDPEANARLLGDLQYLQGHVHGAAEVGEMINRLEAVVDNAQAETAAAEWDVTPEDEKPPVNPEVPW